MTSKTFFWLTCLIAIQYSNQSAYGFDWSTSDASAQGRGCSTMDVSFLANGPDVSVILSNMVVELSQPSQGYQISKDCQIKIPFHLDPGSYEGELSETVTIGLIKSEGADAQVDFKSRIVDPLSRLSAGRFLAMQNKFRRGSAVVEPLLVRNRTTSFGQESGQRCLLSRTPANAHVPLTYDAQLMLTASRADLNQDVYLQSDSLDIRLDLSQNLFPCQNSRPLPHPRPIPRPLPHPIPRPQPPPRMTPHPIPRPQPPPRVRRS